MGNSVHFQSQASDSYEANKAKLIKSFIKVGPASKCNSHSSVPSTSNFAHVYTTYTYIYRELCIYIHRAYICYVQYNHRESKIGTRVRTLLLPSLVFEKEVLEGVTKELP